MTSDDGRPAVPIVRLATVDSTNDEARRRLAAGTIDRATAIVAGEQTGGRGTRGRRWDSPAGAGLYLSLAMPGDRWPLASPEGADPAAATIGPPVQLAHTLAAGVATAETLRTILGVRVHLKPVNDLVVDGAKLGGILVETVLRAGRIESMVVGVGINLSDGPRVVAPSGLPATTVAAIRRAASAPGDPPIPDAKDWPDAAVRRRLESELVHRLAAWTARTVREGEEPIRAAWSAWAVPGAAAPRPV